MYLFFINFQQIAVIFPVSADGICALWEVEFVKEHFCLFATVYISTLFVNDFFFSLL